jgi:glycogen phosphorylase
VAITRARLKAQRERLGATRADIVAAEEVFDPEALTIGFARRFATYKRGTLVFRNLERLNALLNNKDRPVQLVFSGKAHPKDQGGKELIAQLSQYARRPDFRRRVVFLEDYDMNLARYLIQGVDVWLNNPRRPLEASGTSGMKVCVNGGLNLSVLDGWWDEGYRGDNGWRIGSGEEFADQQYQDEVESSALYDLMEREIVPEFYTRGADGLPRAWIKRMKRSIATNVSVFNTNRMVREYTEVSYVPSHDRMARLLVSDFASARALAAWRRKVRDHWREVRVEDVTAPPGEALHVGDEFTVEARVNLGALEPDDVSVQLYHGVIDSFGEIAHPRVTLLRPVDGSLGMFSGSTECRASGQYGFCVRVLPKHVDLANSFEPGLVTWG